MSPVWCPSLHWLLLSGHESDFRWHWLTYQTRYVRVHVSRRAMHASGDSPCRSSAKHHLLRACLPRMVPFRSMLLTIRSGPHCLAPRAHRVPVYPKAFLHSYMPLSRRTVLACHPAGVAWLPGGGWLAPRSVVTVRSQRRSRRTGQRGVAGLPPPRAGLPAASCSPCGLGNVGHLASPIRPPGGRER